MHQSAARRAIADDDPIGTTLVKLAPTSAGFARNYVIAASFGVVAFSVLIQGMTLQPLLKKLGLLEESK